MRIYIVHYSSQPYFLEESVIESAWALEEHARKRLKAVRVEHPRAQISEADIGDAEYAAYLVNLQTGQPGLSPNYAKP